MGSYLGKRERGVSQLLFFIDKTRRTWSHQTSRGLEKSSQTACPQRKDMLDNC